MPSPLFRALRPPYLSLLALAIATPALPALAEQNGEADRLELRQDSQPLADALLLITRKSGTTVIFDPELVRPYRSAPINATLSTEEALKAALQGTDLTLQRGSNGSYVIRRKTMDQAASSAQELPALTVTANRISHLAQRNRTGTRTEVDPMELPQTVTTIDKSLLAQQQVRNVYEAMSNVAGAGTTSDEGAQSASISLRGFAASWMRNGGVKAFCHS